MITDSRCRSTYLAATDCYLGVSKGGFTGGFHARGKLGPLAISMGQALSGHATLFR